NFSVARTVIANSLMSWHVASASGSNAAVRGALAFMLFAADGATVVDATVSITDCQLTGNQLVFPNTGVSYASGAALYVTDAARINLQRTIVSRSTLLMAATPITQIYVEGGAVSLSGADVHIDECQFNETITQVDQFITPPSNSFSGGAIYLLLLTA